MIKKSLAFFLMCIILASVSGLSYAAAEEPRFLNLPEGSIVIAAKNATFTTGEGVTIENKKAPTQYNEDVQMIVNIGKGGEILFTVPDNVIGFFDLYLTVSKILTQFTSQPFSFCINDSDVFSVPIDCQVSADSPFAYTRDGEEYNTGSILDTGRFPVLENVELKAGDKIKIIAEYGAKSGNMKGMAFPAVGELLLAPVGTDVPTGYDYTIQNKGIPDPNDLLSGLNIIWIGSSVTYGAASAGHYSMVDALEDNHPGTVCEKYAINATTLVNQSEDSYVARLKKIPKSKTPDLVVVQLSTNDATTNKPFGTISDSRNISDFDDTTIAGAIETMISYTEEVFHCPVVFYSGSYCEKENYSEMVQLLLDIQKKWNIGVIDLYNNQDMTAIYDTELYHKYMKDEIHPYRVGYVEWWTPVIEDELTNYLSSLL